MDEQDEAFNVAKSTLNILKDPKHPKYAKVQAYYDKNPAGLQELTNITTIWSKANADSIKAKMGIDERMGIAK